MKAYALALVIGASLGSFVTHKVWLGVHNGYKVEQAEASAAGERKAREVLQAAHDRELEQHDLRLQERDNAISNLERAANVRDSEFRAMADRLAEASADIDCDTFLDQPIVCGFELHPRLTDGTGFYRDTGRDQVARNTARAFAKLPNSSEAGCDDQGCGSPRPAFARSPAPVRGQQGQDN